MDGHADGWIVALGLETVKLLRRFVDALETIASEIQLLIVIREREFAHAVLERGQTLKAYEDQQILLRRLSEQQSETLAAAERWRAEEREHMKVCERRYRAQILGQPVTEPIKH